MVCPKRKMRKWSNIGPWIYEFNVKQSINE